MAIPGTSRMARAAWKMRVPRVKMPGLPGGSFKPGTTFPMGGRGINNLPGGGGMGSKLSGMSTKKKAMYGGGAAAAVIAMGHKGGSSGAQGSPPSSSSGGGMY